MKIDITLVCGLPASGKTMYANSIVKPNGIIIDDPKCLKEVKKVLETNPQQVIITDPYFCVPEVLDEAVERLQPHNITKVFFRNNPIQCLINAKSRENKKVDNLINLLSDRYQPYEEDGVLPVYSKEKSIYVNGTMISEHTTYFDFYNYFYRHTHKTVFRDVYLKWKLSKEEFVNFCVDHADEIEDVIEE